MSTGEREANTGSLADERSLGPAYQRRGSLRRLRAGGVSSARAGMRVLSVVL
jgi:hypothetical protein